VTLQSATRVLSRPLKFGDKRQIKAARFLEAVEAYRNMEATYEQINGDVIVAANESYRRRGWARCKA
jgi:hypothetical protein